MEPTNQVKILAGEKMKNIGSLASRLSCWVYRFCKKNGAEKNRKDTNGMEQETDESGKESSGKERNRTE